MEEYCFQFFSPLGKIFLLLVEIEVKDLTLNKEFLTLINDCKIVNTSAPLLMLEYT